MVRHMSRATPIVGWAVGCGIVLAVAAGGSMFITGGARPTAPADGAYRQRAASRVSTPLSVHTISPNGTLIGLTGGAGPKTWCGPRVMAATTSALGKSVAGVLSKIANACAAAADVTIVQIESRPPKTMSDAADLPRLRIVKRGAGWVVAEKRP